VGTRRRLIAAVTGTVLVAICCFTPILVLVLAALGFAALTPYVDYVLFPALAVMAFVTWRAYRRYVRERPN
jgi:mercuric ion transport protein